MKICSEHGEHQVPLISTMAFMGAEFWCPQCGQVYGIFGNYEDVEETEELTALRVKAKIIAHDFLNAKSTQACDSMMWEGERITPDKLPEHAKQEFQAIIDSWKYGQVI